MKPGNAGRTFPAEVLTPAEVNRLIAACSRRGNAGLRNRALIVVLFRSGLRIAEALALRPKDVNLEEGTIQVLHGKGDRRRVVGLDPEAGGVLELWLARRRELGVHHTAPVFCVISQPNVGKPLYSAYVREALKDLAVKAGIEKRVHPHGFRHSYAVHLNRNGVPIKTIQTLLGHSSLGTTDRYISHLDPYEAIQAVRGLDWGEPIGAA